MYIFFVLYSFVLCKRIGRGGLRPPAGGGVSPLLPALPSRKNRYVRVSRKYYQHEATCNRKSFLIFSRGGSREEGRSPSTCGEGRCPPVYTLTTQKKCTCCRKKKFVYEIFFVHLFFFANNDRRIKPSEPYSGPRP